MPPRKKTAEKTTTPGKVTAPPEKTTTVAPAREKPLPAKGSIVDYEATDPLTGEQMTGVGIVVDAYSQGEGKNRIHRVLLSRLSSDLNLSADDVKAAHT